MIVVGGSYVETVLYPSHSSVFMGSGLRAASVLGEDVDLLVTIASYEDRPAIEQQVSSLKIVSRPTTVEYRYLDPAVRPQVRGLPTATPDALTISYPRQDVLAFGLAEYPQGYPVVARRVVFDPQSPQGLDPRTLAGIQSERIAVCANRAEARRLTGFGSPTDAAEALLKLPGVEVVVVKCGALGYVVAEHAQTMWRHATPTLLVHSLGSGDIFSSVFAREWFGGKPAVEAAEAASLAVADSVAGHQTSQPHAPLPHRPGYAPRVYLAGPFFTLGERWMVERVRANLDALGARVFSPIHDVGPGNIEVAQKDLDGLDSCDVVLALLDGFDPGTVYEAGWAARENIPIVGFSSETHAKESKMLVGMGAEVHTDLSTAMYRAIWAGQGLKLTPGIHDERARA